MKLFPAKIVLSILISALTAFGASGDVDAGFNPLLTFDLTDNYAGTPVMQPDGKMIVYGYYQTLFPGAGGSRNFIKRLNPDGTLDPTFNCPECLTFIPTSVAVQADGSLLVGGGGIFRGQIIRVDQNGKLDASFKTWFYNPDVYCGPGEMVTQPDGKVVVKCASETLGGSRFDVVRRLNTNGSIDPTFSTIATSTNPAQSIRELVGLPDGKLLVGFQGDSTAGGLKRYNPDGSVDNTFAGNPNGSVLGIGVLADGKYLIAGSFSSVNGTSRSKIARLFPDGNLDTSFSAPTASNEILTGMELAPNGQFYIRLYVDPFPVPSPPVSRFVRYNAAGSVDNTFSQTFTEPESWTVDGSNRIVVFRTRTTPDRFFRLIDGNIDPTFEPTIAVDGFNMTAALQTDGKIVVAGVFDKLNGAGAGRIARINTDGTPDAAFNTGTGFDVAPTTVAVQSDGKILAGGLFTAFNGTPRANIARLNADGSLDASFGSSITGTNPNIYAIAPLANGKFLIGGKFTNVNGTAREGLARLNADGSLDSDFNLGLGASSIVYTILVQADGKIMIGGTLIAPDGLLRLNSDGSPDSSFDLSSSTNAGSVFQRADGKYVVATRSSGGAPSHVILLHNNGARDYTFRDWGSGAETVFAQPNGNVLFGGRFYDGERFLNIGRVGPHGEADIYFPVLGANDTVHKIIGQPDGKIIVAGSFSGIEDVGRSGIARLTLSNRIHGTPFDYDGDGRADVSVFRPSTNTWYELLSGNWSVGIQNLGAGGDLATPADYDGDGKTDIGIFRPSIGDWLYLSSSTNTLSQIHYGQNGDIPRPSDVNADGKAELVVWRPSTGVWYGAFGGDVPFGLPEDKPLIGDFDGDGKCDPAVFRPSTGDWWYAATSAGLQHRTVHWGQTGDIPVPGDFDGDGRTDFVVFRPSDGGWYILYSTGSYTIATFGTVGDKPVAADFDGDGKTDIAVFRPADGIWYLLQTTAGFGALQWGISTDVPTQNAFLP